MKKFFFCLVVILFGFDPFSSVFAQVSMHENSLLSHSKQVVIVVTKDWNSIQGYLYTFDRSDPKNEKWMRAPISSPVVLGKNGMGWGSGFENKSGPKKVEGDYRSPAGMYPLTKIFGFESVGGFSIHMPYKRINTETVCVDDTSSRYYGEIIDASPHVYKDWNSAEQMSQYKEYKWGVFINYSSYQKKLNQGSCIFLHAWDSFTTTTAGCTAMPEKIIKELVFWLNKKSNPMFVQMPLKEYVSFAKENRLPHLE